MKSGVALQLELLLTFFSVGKSRQNVNLQSQQIHQGNRQTYGSLRINAALIAQGFRVGCQRVRRLMAKLGIIACRKRQFKVKTIATTILYRDFTTEPDRIWVVDMTYMATTEG